MSTIVLYNRKVEMVAQACCWPECGIVFGVPKSWDDEQKRTHKRFFCPNGHGQSYTGETKEQILKKELEVARKTLVAANEAVKFERTRADKWRVDSAHQKRKTRAQKAAKTRIKNRVARGVCPCCNRTFVNLQRHMHGQHPDWSE